MSQREDTKQDSKWPRRRRAVSDRAHTLRTVIEHSRCFKPRDTGAEVSYLYPKSCPARVWKSRLPQKRLERHVWIRHAPQE